MIAICIPCWNQLWYTRVTCESIRRNSAGHDIKFFFVDNGSTDDTYDYLCSIAGAHIIRNATNLGCNPAWNQLLAAALAEHPTMIVLANNDLKVGPGWLEPAVRELAKSDLRYFLPNGEFNKNDETFDDDVRAAAPANAGKTVLGEAGWCLFFRPESVRLFMPIPDRLKIWYGDNFIHRVLAHHGYKCEVLLDSYVLHYLSKTVGGHPNFVKIVAEDKAAFEEIMKERGL